MSLYLGTNAHAQSVRSITFLVALAKCREGEKNILSKCREGKIGRN